MIIRLQNTHSGDNDNETLGYDAIVFDSDAVEFKWINDLDLQCGVWCATALGGEPGPSNHESFLHIEDIIQDIRNGFLKNAVAERSKNDG